MYNNQMQSSKECLSKSELIYKNFTQLVMQNYNQTRNVMWYAEKLKISNIHLCTTVKKSQEIHVQKLFHTWLSWMPNHN